MGAMLAFFKEKLGLDPTLIFSSKGRKSVRSYFYFMPAEKNTPASECASNCLSDLGLKLTKSTELKLAPRLTGAQISANQLLKKRSKNISKESQTLADKPLLEFTLFNVEQAIATLTTGDFRSKWDHSRHFAKQFAHWGDRPIPHLIDHLQNSSNVENQWFLIRTLSQFMHSSVIETLASFLVSTPEESLQAEAIKALTGLGSDAIATLTHLLSCPATEQRRLAAVTLAKIRRSAVIEPLLSIAHDPDVQLRAIAIEALGSFHDPRITPVLFSALNDQSAIAIEAARTLGRRSDLLTSTDILALLQGCLLSRESEIARESAIALGRLGTQPGGEVAAEILGQFLTQAAPSSVKVAAVRALGWLDAPAATLHLSAAFDCPFPLVMPDVRQEIARSLGQTQAALLQIAAAQPLVHWLQSQTHQQSNQQSEQPADLETLALKQIVISSLARLGVPDTISTLIPLLGDPDARIRMHALNALKQIDPHSAQAKVKDYLANEAISLHLKEKITDSLSAW